MPFKGRLKTYQAACLRWLLETDRPTPKSQDASHHKTHAWWQVMCLTGVDYFSTLGYQPGIAAVAAGALSPIATLILVLLTLFGALPIYRRVAAMSPHGEGSIAMLEHLLPWWQGKLFVLCLLGFMATDFIITITLSAADATAHIIENPLVPHFLSGQQVSITLLLVGLLGAIFLKGFQEAIGIAVYLVALYLCLNFITIVVSCQEIFQHPELITRWQHNLFAQQGNPIMLLLVAALLFPKLALGLSGFETGVAVMPLIRGDRQDLPDRPQGRIRNTGKLLTTAALIMSGFLISSSLVTTLAIDPAEFQSGGKANGRALAYLAHAHLGEWFGTLYDLSTISILWFAGASAMAGLLNIVPRYLPRYGMAPNWVLVTRPLVLVYTTIALVVTIIFQANVEAQGGAYATGVLVLMSSAAFAVMLAIRKRNNWRKTLVYSLITLVFLYTTIVNILERPDGIKISAFFIGTIITTSLISRVWRSTELRASQIEFDEVATGFIDDLRGQSVRLIAHRPNRGSAREYAIKEREMRDDNHIPETDSVLFLEIQVSDPSAFADTIQVRGVMVGNYRILRARGSAVPNTIASLLLEMRDRTGCIPHSYFGWVEGNPVQYLLRFLLFGEGDTAVVTREVLRRAEKDPDRRPAIHVGG